MQPKTAYFSKPTLHRRDDLIAYAASEQPRGTEKREERIEA
jgi:hypothetical protein